MPSSIHDTEAEVSITVEIRMPRADAPAFAEAMTGDDKDVILAAERAIRDRIDSEGVEIWTDGRATEDYVRAEAHAERRCQAIYGPPADPYRAPSRAGMWPGRDDNDGD